MMQVWGFHGSRQFQVQWICMRCIQVYMHKVNLSIFGCIGHGQYTVGHVRRKTIGRVIEHVNTMEETHRTNTCDMSKLAVT